MNLNRIDYDTMEAVRRFLALIAQRYELAGAFVYGSRARGTHRPDSDADVAVLLKGERQRGLKTTLAMADIAYDVLLETGINIAPLLNKPPRIDSSITTRRIDAASLCTGSDLLYSPINP